MLIISMMLDDVKICCGPECTNFIINGDVYTCNKNNLVPTKQILSEGQIDSIYYGKHHTLFIEKSKKEIYSWGDNSLGQLGLGDTNKRDTPQKIMFDFGSKIMFATCSDYQTFVGTELGELYICGFHYFYSLGNGYIVPYKFSIEHVKSVSCSWSYVIIMTKYECFGCGNNEEGQLGLGDTINRRLPQKLVLSDIISISCGAYHTIALTSDGVYSWGNNKFGQLGLGDHLTRCTPEKIDLSDIYVISISCGSHHTMILTSDGKLFGSGINDRGQLGLCHISFHQIKFQLINLNEKILSVNCYRNRTIVTTKSGKYYGWGENWDGQLGLGDRDDRSKPTEIVIKI